MSEPEAVPRWGTYGGLITVSVGVGIFMLASSASAQVEEGPEAVAGRLLSALAAQDLDRAAALFHHAPPRTEEEHVAHHWWVNRMLRRLFARVGALGEYAPVVDTESEVIAAIGAGSVAFRRAPEPGTVLLTYRAAFEKAPDAHLHIFAVRAGAGWEIDELDFAVPSASPGAQSLIGWLVTELMPIE